MNTIIDAHKFLRSLLPGIVGIALVATAVSGVQAQTIFFSDSFNRPDSLKLDATTNSMAGMLMTNGTFTVSNIWLEPIDVGRSVPGDAAITNNTLRLGGNGHSVNIVLDRNFATLMSTGILSVTLKLNGTPAPNDSTATNRYQGIGFGFSRSEGNVVSASVDRVLSRVADVFVAETANGRIRINDELWSLRNQTAGQDVAPTTAIPATNGATAFVAGTLRLDFTITNAAIGSTIAYAMLFDAGNTGLFTTLANRSFILSDNFQLYAGIENRSTPSVLFDDLTISALGAYGPPVNTGLAWRAQVNNTWDATTTNWVDATFGNDTKFSAGQNVKFDDSASNATVNVPAAVGPGIVSLENISSNYTFTGAGAITGTASLSKIGSGTATMSLSNGFSGGSILSAGKFRVGNDSVFGSGPLTLSGGSLSSDSTTARTLANATKITTTTTLGNATDNGRITFSSPIDFNGAGRALTINSDVLFAGGAANGILGSKQGKGTLTINGVVNYSGASDAQDGTLIYDGASVTNTDRLIADTAGVNGIARLVISNGSTVTVTTTVGNFRSGRQASTGTNYVDLAGLYSLPNADSADGNITLQANTAYSEMTFWPGGDFTARSVALNGTGTGTTVFKFNGGILRARNDNPTFFQGLSQTLVQAGGANIDDGGFNITINQSLLNGGGGGGLNKIGGGTLLLNGNNTYTGSTVVSNGAFGGSGIISGPVRITSGATLVPGGATNTIGSLTINNNLTLDAGSFAFMGIDKGNLTNDLVTGLNNVSYSGTLIVSNVSGTPLIAGDSFTLFKSSGTVTGNFSSVTALPVAGLLASFNPNSGVLSVLTPPAGTDFYTVSGGSIDNVFSVLTNDVGNGLVIVGVSTPPNGTAVISDSNILYTPNTGFVGVDMFTYTNQDILGSNSVLTVVVTVTTPLSLNDHYQVLRNSSSNMLDVLRNDGAGMSLISLTQLPTNGTAFVSGTNVIYSPNSNYFGPDTFVYAAQDTNSVTNFSTVTIDVRQYPNFVFVLADDQGWTGLSVLMDTNRANSKSDYYSTPRMETLASQSLRFSYGYSPHPDCSPSRYSNLTGKMPARTKMTDIVGRNNAPVSGQYKLIAPGKLTDSLQTNDLTTAQLLKAIPGANYSCAHFGKWHLNGGGPVMHGFDADANDGATDNTTGNQGTAPINPDPKLAYSVTGRALNFLDSRVTNGIPFYLQISHYAVHETTQTSQSSFNAFNGKPWGTWHTNQWYAGMTLDLDINVGRLLDKLDALGIRNSTYVIYQSDNGAPQAQSQNYPLRRYKPEVWEGGTRVPTFVRGPGIPANKQCDVPVCGIDILPTIMEWAAGSTTNVPPDVDGGSLVPLLKAVAQGSNSLPAIMRGGDFVTHCPHYVGPLPWPNDWQVLDKDMRPRSSIHDGRYKLVANYEPGTIELYDLNSDIGEHTNLSPAQLAIKWQLWVRLRDYLKMVNAQMPTLDPTYPGTTNGTFVLAGATGSLGDADSDGLSDDWEFRELLTYQYNGSDDPSHSGMTLAQAHAQNLDPLVPNAYRINTITPVGTNQLQLTWSSTPGASFTVEVSSNLVEWVPAQTVTAGDVFYGTATINIIAPQDFFRVRKQ